MPGSAIQSDSGKEITQQRHTFQSHDGGTYMLLNHQYNLAPQRKT